MGKNLPGLHNDSSGVKNPTIFELQPAKKAFLFLTVLFRIAMVGFFLAFSLFFLVITLSLLVGQTNSTNPISQGSTTTKVLGTSTNDNSIFSRVVKTVLGPIGKVSLWLIKLAGDDEKVIDPLATTGLNEIFEYDATGEKIIVKKQLILLDTPISSGTVVTWNSIKGTPSLLSSINSVGGVAGDIKLAEGNNITITGDKSKNTITISSTGAATVTGNIDVNLTAGSGISVSGASPDFTIANTSLGSSQNIFKNVTVSGSSTVVADSNNDTLTFVAGANIGITTSAAGDSVTFAVTGSVANADTLDLLDSLQFLRSDTSDSFTSGTLTIAGGTTLSVTGALICTDCITLGGETAGNYVESVATGSGLTGGAAGSEGAILTLSLSNLTADWSQSGAFDIVLDNAASEFRALESVGGTFYGTLDIGDLSADRTYTFPDSAGTVCISGGTCTASSVPFSGVTAGTNTNALVIGTGGSLTISGSGSIVATDLAATSSVVSDTEVDDNLTIDVTGSVSWAALASYPTACGAGTAVTTLADSPTCTAFTRAPVAETITGAWTFSLAETEDLAIDISISGTNSGQGGIITLTNSSTSGSQYGLYIDNTASTGTTEALLVLDNSDIDTAVTAAIQIIDAGGGFTTIIDNAGILISGAELNLLDGHDVALVDTNDTVTTAITGTGALTAGSIAAGFGTISTSNTITGATINATTGVNTGSGAGTNRIDVNGNLVNIGSITSPSAANTYSFTSTQATGNVFSITNNSLTTGTGLNLITTSNTLTSGKLLNIDHTASYTTTQIDSGNILNLNRAFTTNGASAITFDDSSNAGAKSGSSGDWSHAIGSGVNRILIVKTSVSIDSTTVSSITYGGVGLTQIPGCTKEYLNFAGSVTEMWYLLNPNTGTDTIAVTLSGSPTDGWTAAGVSYAEVSQTDTFRASCNTESGDSGTNANLSVTSESGDLVIDAITNSASGRSLTVGAGQTERQNQNFGIASYGVGAYSEETAVGATTTMSWTVGGTGGDWTHVGVALIPGPILTFSGALANLTSNCTQTAGTCTDTSNILSLTQSYASASGAVLNISNSGTGADISLANGETIDNNTNGIILLKDGGGTTLISTSTTDLKFNLDDTTTFTETLCHSGADGATGVVDVGDCNVSGGGDIAEYYGTDGSLEAGDVVVIDASKPAQQIDDPELGFVSKTWVKASESSYEPTVIGIVSTNPYREILSAGVFSDDENPMPIALAGRVPTKVSTENGDIAPGDPLTSSSTPGVAMRATESGPIIGKALEGYTGSGVSKIMVFVSVGWFVAPLEQDGGSQISDLSEINTETLTAGTISTEVLFIGDRQLNMAPDGSLVIDGSVNILGDLKVEGELTAEKLNVSDKAAGSATLKAGQTKIEIETSLITDKSQVLITLNTLTERAVAVTEKEEGKGFTVEISSPATKNIKFDWFVIN